MSESTQSNFCRTQIKHKRENNPRVYGASLASNV